MSYQTVDKLFFSSSALNSVTVIVPSQTEIIVFLKATILLLFKYLIMCRVCVCMCRNVHKCYDVHVEARGQHERIGSLILPCESEGYQMQIFRLGC